MTTRENEGRSDDGLERMQRIRGGNRGMITKLERGAQTILREYREIPNDELITKINSIIAALREKN